MSRTFKNCPIWSLLIWATSTPVWLSGITLGSEYWHAAPCSGPWVWALGITNSFSYPSTSCMLSSWFYLVCLIWYYYLSVKFVMWIVKQKIENKQNLFLKRDFLCFKSASCLFFVSHSHLGSFSFFLQFEVVDEDDRHISISVQQLLLLLFGLFKSLKEKRGLWGDFKNIREGLVHY